MTAEVEAYLNKLKTDRDGLRHRAQGALDSAYSHSLNMYLSPVDINGLISAIIADAGVTMEISDQIPQQLDEDQVLATGYVGKEKQYIILIVGVGTHKLTLHYCRN